jgi:hypothetical protein
VRNLRSMAVDGTIGGHDPPPFAGGLPGRYEHRLLPICCPTQPPRTFRTAIRIAHSHHPSCMSRKGGDLRFL